MPYFAIERTYTVKETVIVKANSKHEAFQNAGDDINCSVKISDDGDYEPNYNSITELNPDTISDVTRKALGE